MLVVLTTVGVFVSARAVLCNAAAGVPPRICAHCCCAKLAMLKQGFKMFATERSGRERMDVKVLGDAMRSFGANPLNAQLDLYLEEFEEMEKGELVCPASPRSRCHQTSVPCSRTRLTCAALCRFDAATPGFPGLSHQDGTAEEGGDEKRGRRL